MRYSERVPFVQPMLAYRTLADELDAAAHAVLDSGQYILGPHTEEFERRFAAYCETGHAVGVGSGLAALELALRAANVGPGQEVIVPAHTFIATWLAISRTGATPVPVDVEASTLLLDVSSVAHRLTPRTRAIIPVHLYGSCVDVVKLRDVVGDESVLILEDAAQAHGARCRERRSGSLGDVAAFSFYPTKNLGAFGDGGAVVTARAGIAEGVRLLRSYGSPAKYEHTMLGDNSRLDPLQAACLTVKLDRLEEWNARRREIASTYTHALLELPEFTLTSVPEGCEPVWHLFTVRHPQRDALRAHLERYNVETLIHYPQPPHLSGAYSGKWPFGSFPVTESACQQLVSLPMDPFLTDEQVTCVIEAMQGFAQTK